MLPCGYSKRKEYAPSGATLKRKNMLPLGLLSKERICFLLDEYRKCISGSFAGIFLRFLFIFDTFKKLAKYKCFTILRINMVSYTVKSDKNGHSKKDKVKILKTNDSLMKV